MADADFDEHAVADAGKRALHGRGARLFGRNTVASIGAFAFDMALLALLVELAGISYLPAAATAFVLAMSAQYVVSRIWVFKHSDRGLAAGYFYFLLNTAAGLVVTLAVFWLLLELAGMHYLLARAAASVVAGLVVFSLNAVFNFKAL